jgi:hypothetical protein
MDPQLVRATVVDIGNRHAMPERIAVDANVLKFVFYPNFGLIYDIPIQHTRGLYARFIEDALRHRLPPRTPGEPPRKVEVCTSAYTVGEFARTAEHTEIEIRWRQDHGPASKFGPLECKDARYAYASEIAAIRASVMTMVKTIRSAISLLPQSASAGAAMDASAAEWTSSLGDFADAMLLSRCKAVGVSCVLADDKDMATADGITLYTSNPKVIAAARTGGRLGR